jgi:micrococcal nuclease
MWRRQGIPVVATRTEAAAGGFARRPVGERLEADAIAQSQHGRASRAMFAVLIALGLIAALIMLSQRASVRPVVATDLPITASGRAESIDDGDTFVFVPTSPAGQGIGRIRIRLHGVDAPELLQRHGAAARAALADLLRDARVSVDCYKRDAQGRAICRVDIDTEGAGPRDLELALLEAGHVWHYAAYAREQTATDRERYATAMAQAQAARRGLWQDDAALAPWACRARLRAGRRCD